MSEYATFKDWAWNVWKGWYGQSPAWSDPEFVCLKKGHKRLGDSRARYAWLAFMRDGSDFVKGHNPKKWIFDLDRWSTGSMGSDRIEPDAGQKASWRSRAEQIFEAAGGTDWNEQRRLWSESVQQARKEKP